MCIVQTVNRRATCPVSRPVNIVCLLGDACLAFQLSRLCSKETMFRKLDLLPSSGTMKTICVKPTVFLYRRQRKLAKQIYRCAPMSTDSVSAVFGIRSSPRPENKFGD
jgi:hypothetical protein